MMKKKAKMFKKLRKHNENEMLNYNSKMLLMNAEFINFRLSKMKEQQKIKKLLKCMMNNYKNMLQYNLQQMV